jgi:signal transduction histidine kinase
LQAIENAAYYLNTELPCLSPPGLIPQKIMEMLQVIDYSINYADKIIRDLRDFSTAIEPTLAKTNINILIKEILSQVKSPQNIELSTELDELPEIKVDENQMRRVFHSLIMNGIQAMESGGTLTVATKQTNGLVEIGFKDTGIGIPKENMDKLFKPLFTTKAKGMGMGLAICKKFVNAHGGKIEVESEVGKGTTVTIKLPIQQENASVKKGLGVERLEG